MAVDRRLVGAVGSAALAALCAAWLGQPLIHGNEHAQTLIATFFSILAGFLIAITTVLGDPSILARRTWRAGEISRGHVERELLRQKLLFVLYLMTLGLLMVAAVADDTAARLTKVVEYIYLGLGTFAFLLSLGLLWSLMKIQLDRYDVLIRDKRRQVGLKD